MKLSCFGWSSYKLGLNTRQTLMKGFTNETLLCWVIISHVGIENSTDSDELHSVGSVGFQFQLVR